MTTRLDRLVVVPSEPIATYEQSGQDWLERYYNPAKIFREVYAASPLETGVREAHGMKIIGVPEREFRSFLQDVKPNVVRAYGGYWPADFVCSNRVPDVPVAVSVHDTNPDLLHPSVRYADVVICTSGAVAKQVHDTGTAEERIHILPNRIDLSIFHPVANTERVQSVSAQFPQGKALLHVGRKVRQKNLDTLIRALPLLSSDYFAVFIGPGDPIEYVALAKKLGVGERCFWRESIPNSDLPIWYSWATCMCTPSRWEGFGIVFLEAAACGAGIVTSNVAPMNEYLKNGTSACLVEEYENPAALAKAIRNVCEDSQLRAALGSGAEQVARRFDHRIVDAQEAKIYREIASLTPRVLTPAESKKLQRSLIFHRAKVASNRRVRSLKRMILGKGL